MTPKKQVSSVIRISQRERDVSARATHLEAATRKFLVTTNERKQMSTKTNFKRIALVAVAALGLGLLSSVPTQAASIGTPTVTVTNGTATIGTSDSTTAATIAVRYYAEANTDTAGIEVRIGARPSTSATHSVDSLMVAGGDTATSTALTALNGKNGNVTGAFSTNYTDSARVALTSGGVWSALAGGVITPGGAGFAAGKFKYFLETGMARVAGTYTINYVVRIYDAGVLRTSAGGVTAGTLDIVVSDAALAGLATTTASGTSSAVFYGGDTFAAGNTIDSTNVSAVVTPTGTASAVIRVTQKTATGTPARESITVTSTIGNIGTSCATAGKSLVIQADTDGIDDLTICADGTSGTSVITVKTTSVTFANKSITWYASTPTTITATALVTTIGSSSTSAILAVPKDALGNTLRSTDAVYAYSDALTVINTGTAPAGTSCGSYNADYEGYLCSLAGSTNGTANITIRNASTSAASTVASTAVALKVNTAAAASFTLAFNKATYAPGEKAYIIVKPLDAAKGAIGGTTMTNLLASGGITSTMAFGSGSDTLTAVTFATAGTLATQGVASTEAIKLYTVYMPVSGGTMTITATGGSLLPASGQVKVTATATITDSGAAALAAVNALATTVASLRTLITTLTNLVLKIQKKVKA
jgi:hypothetical protein